MPECVASPVSDGLDPPKEKLGLGSGGDPARMKESQSAERVAGWGPLLLRGEKI